jgi:hypothetical protein
MNIRTALRNDRLCASLTGLRIKEFESLVHDFSWNYIEYEHTRKPKRERRVGGGRKSQLKGIEEKLFYILFYLRTYPTFDLASVYFEFHRSNACEWVKILLPVLETTLKRKLVLPIRKISTPEEFERLFPGIKEVFGDATERKINRPKNVKHQRKTYSGKKKINGRKNVILSDSKRRILVLTQTKSARRHDKRLADKQQLFQSIPESTTILVDTGFQGIQKYHNNTLIPKKNTKKNPLTEQDKLENKLISSFRVVVEHAIAGMKRYNCLKQQYRNKRAYLDDKFAIVSAGLWNYHLSYST